jgi:hypothetical protein
MYYGKSLTVAVVSALCYVSGLPTPIESGGSGYYPAECSGFLINSCTCNQGREFCFRFLTLHKKTQLLMLLAVI